MWVEKDPWIQTHGGVSHVDGTHTLKERLLRLYDELVIHIDIYAEK